MSAPARRFLRHYLEMVAAMVLGMVVLGLAARAVVDTSGRPALMLGEMAVTMTLPMVAWMRVRGHGWRACAEMSASMVLPAVGVLALLGSGLVTGSAALMTIEHSVMFPAMFAVMVWRREEYSGQHGRQVAA